MSTTTLCPSCKGLKEVLKLGNMKGPCSACAGKGVVDADSIQTPKPSAPVSPSFGSPRETAQHYVKLEQDAKRDSLKHANVAFLNRPVQIEEKKENQTAAQVAAQKPQVQLNPNIKQAPSIRDPKAPKPIDGDSLLAAKLRSETVERDDTIMAAQRADLAVETEEVVQPAKGKASGKKSKSA